MKLTVEQNCFFKYPLIKTVSNYPKNAIKAIKQIISLILFQVQENVCPQDSSRMNLIQLKKRISLLKDCKRVFYFVPSKKIKKEEHQCQNLAAEIIQDAFRNYKIKRSLTMPLQTDFIEPNIPHSTWSNHVYREFEMRFNDGKNSYQHPTSKEVALIFLPTRDETKAFDMHIKQLDDYIFRAGILNLCKKYSVHFKKISSGEEMERVICEVSKKNIIKVLMISGHGAPKSLSLGKEQYLEPDFIKSSRVFKKLHPEASIVIRGCNTGKIVKDGPNIAQAIATVAKGRKVYAPKEKSYTSHTVIDQIAPFKFSYLGSWMFKPEINPNASLLENLNYRADDYTFCCLR